MKRDWTRRKFLERALKGSMAVGGAVTADIIAPAKAHTAAPAEGTTGAYDEQQEKILHVAMDEIIPAADGMPSVSEVGGLGYLTRIAGQSSQIKREIEKSISALAALSRKQFGREFTALAPVERVEALKKLEAQRPKQNFVRLRDYIYEAYYTQPKVWKLIGYSFYATSGPGPAMTPFDPSSLDRVRKMPKLYREAPESTAPDGSRGE